MIANALSPSQLDMEKLDLLSKHAASITVFPDGRIEAGWFSSKKGSVSGLIVASGWLSLRIPPPGFYSTEAIRKRRVFELHTNPYLNAPFRIAPNLVSEPVSKFEILKDEPTTLDDAHKVHGYFKPAHLPLLDYQVEILKNGAVVLTATSLGLKFYHVTADDEALRNCRTEQQLAEHYSTHLRNDAFLQGHGSQYGMPPDCR